MNLATLLADTVARHPDNVALRMVGADDPRPLTYRALDERIGRFAAALRARGVKPGDRVALMVPNAPEFVVAYWATLRLGGVVVPMNPLLKQREVAYHLRDAEATVFAYWHEMAAHATAGAAEAGLATTIALGADDAELDAELATREPVDGVAERQADDAAVLLYTSGTTGQPKGATLTHSNMTWNAHIAALHVMDAGAGDRVVGTLPLFHSFGQSLGMNVAFHVGAELMLVPRFDPEVVLELLTRQEASVFLGVPTMFNALLHAIGPDGRDCPALRVCISGGAPIPVEVLQGAERELGCPILEGYGLSETSPMASFNHPGQTKAGSIGTPVWGVQMRLVDPDGAPVEDGVGEIEIRGHNVMRGYHGKPEATAAAIDADGWFRTGDLARRDEDGFYFIVDRAKDLILRGGLNVYPREVEEILYEHPAVLEAAVVGIPHPELGEEVGAAVVTRPGASFDAGELREFVREQIAAYKYPRVVVQLDALPKGSTGKILKREIDLTAAGTGRSAQSAPAD